MLRIAISFTHIDWAKYDYMGECQMQKYGEVLNTPIESYQILYYQWISLHYRRYMPHTDFYGLRNGSFNMCHYKMFG